MVCWQVENNVKYGILLNNQPKNTIFTEWLPKTVEVGKNFFKR